MRKNGSMFICDRCKKQVFAERFNDGEYDDKSLEGWTIRQDGMWGIADLCPDCFKAYREGMEKFWNGGEHGI